MRGRLHSLALAVISLTSAVEARAAEPPETPVAPELALTWQAPAGCPTPAEVQAQFARLLGGAARTASGKRIAASAFVRAAAPERWSLELATVMDGAVGRRNLAGDSCASVTSAAALILALMIDPAAAERAAAPVDTPPAPSPGARRDADALVVAVPAPAAPRAWFGFVRAFGGGVVSLLPSPAPAAGLAVGARHRRFSAEVSGLATLDQRVVAAPDVSGDFQLLVGGARACGVLGGRAPEWQLCLGGELERLTGTGVAAPVRSRTALMGAGTGGLVVTLPLGARVGLSLDFDAAVRPYHPFFSDSGAPIFRIPLVSAFAALGVIVTI